VEPVQVPYPADEVAAGLGGRWCVVWRAQLFADDAVLVAPCDDPLLDMRWVGGVRALVRVAVLVVA